MSPSFCCPVVIDASFLPTFRLQNSEHMGQIRRAISRSHPRITKQKADRQAAKLLEVDHQHHLHPLERNTRGKCEQTSHARSCWNRRHIMIGTRVPGPQREKSDLGHLGCQSCIRGRDRLGADLMNLQHQHIQGRESALLIFTPLEVLKAGFMR